MQKQLDLAQHSGALSLGQHGCDGELSALMVPPQAPIGFTDSTTAINKADPILVVTFMGMPFNLDPSTPKAKAQYLTGGNLTSNGFQGPNPTLGEINHKTTSTTPKLKGHSTAY